ncbi:type II toxin-antitoxin system death-on-curing family toxin [Mucilaginibacter sp.]|uniref:type II toxin-antitoxin system death-on-curing family toxin n=1 Tax=Mucilaginibacter sp. TaxID=1882438 RepID=UPI00284EB4CC|nr:type II toxin-antitoxin system death-on-curing family toxin [Mucilaginibacter sp.]MDR3694814.1 type II toxin-antitoxin system death-on-curing family toxin [Mucilaginibacter sp.]
MIEIRKAIFIHDDLINKLGGSKGIRDMGLLDAALNRPFATFDSIDLYPTPFDKASAILESILINHPFIDGNKRTAYVLMKLLLFQNGILLTANQSEKYQMVIKASTGELRFDEIKLWLVSNTTINK